MAVVLIKKVGEEEVHTRIHGTKCRYNPNIIGYDYPFNDVVSENHRRRENNLALSYVAKGLREMKIEARNGFRKIPHKKRVIKDRKKEIDCIIREYGSFLPDELENILKKTYRIVDRIYKPNMKRSRKK